MAIDFTIDIQMHRPEVLKKVRSINNPYDYSTHKLNSCEFIGRLNEVQSFHKILNNYVSNTTLKNITICGEKSIGKSTLLNRFKQILQDYDYAIYETELSIDKGREIGEYDFFKNIINDFYVKYAPIEESCLDVKQQEIWFNLTTNQDDETSTFIDRKIEFATFYSNFLLRKKQELPYETLEKDFTNIVDAMTSPELKFIGVAILIDEFQELQRNVFILDTLRKLSENITGLIIIGSGLPELIDNKSFEKFVRTSYPISLNKFNDNEILDLIYNPIETYAGISKFEVQDVFDQDSIRKIISRSGGNPLDIKILCSKIFDYFYSNPDSNCLQLNVHVVEEAMKYYASISEKSKRIRDALNTCTKDQLDSFKKVYYYEGLNIRAIILLKNAFGPLSSESEEALKNEILDDLSEIFDFNLFELNGKAKSIFDLKEMSPIALSGESYNFIGDTFDKLYVAYLFENLTNTRLYHNNNDSFENLLCKELSKQLSNVIKEKNINVPLITAFEFTKLSINPLQTNYSYDEISKDILKIAKIKTSGKQIKEKNVELIRQISEKYDLRFPATIAQALDLVGYYTLSTFILIKGKKRIITTFFPVKNFLSDANNIAQEIIIDKTSFLSLNLNEYMLSIENCSLTWLSKEALTNIINADIEIEHSNLLKKIKNREFEDACRSASNILSKGVQLKEEGITVHANWFNNYAFCLINIGDIELAKNIFKDIHNKCLISKINLAYIYLLEKNWRESKNILKQIYKKHKNNIEIISTAILHLSIMHPDLLNQNKIIDDTNALNCVLWNLALISIQFENNLSSSNSFMKKIKFRNNMDSWVHKRVQNWISFFHGNINKAFQGSKKILKQIDANRMIYLDLKKDIEIFSSCLKGGA